MQHHYKSITKSTIPPYNRIQTYTLRQTDTVFRKTSGPKTLSSKILADRTTKKFEKYLIHYEQNIPNLAGGTTGLKSFFGKTADRPIKLRHMPNDKLNKLTKSREPVLSIFNIHSLQVNVTTNYSFRDTRVTFLYSHSGKTNFLINTLKTMFD